MVANRNRPMTPVLLCDVDGVLLDSYPSHCRATEGLLALMGDHQPLASRADERQRFGLATLTERFGEGVADTLVSARPALMATLIDTTPLVTAMIEVLAEVGLPTILITAGYAGAVQHRLGDLGRHFEAILGCETAPKEDLLANYGGRARAYICDTTSDVRKCLYVGIPAIGVSWGFDSREELIAAGSQSVVDSPAQLLALIGGGLC